MAAPETLEGSAWVDIEGAWWLDVEQVCNVKVSIFSPHEQGNAPAPTPSVVYGPCGFLSTIPYFQTCLSEPWQKGSSPTASDRREIILQCTDSTFPSDYVNCLLVNLEGPPPMSVDDALRLLRAADHLLFQECADYCMAYLASSPWSDKEEEGIQQTISSMGVKPSSDLTAKLTFADDVKVFKEVLVSLTQKAGTAESVLSDFVKATFKEASEEVASVCVSLIRDAWTTATNLLINKSSWSFSLWIVLTKLLLEHGDAETLLENFVGVSKKLSSATIRLIERNGIAYGNGLAEIFAKLLLCAVPKKSNNKAVLLSNPDRAELVAAWVPMVGKLSHKPLESAFSQLFMSLPLQDPVVVAIVKEEAGNAYFDTCYKWWRSRLFKRMNRCGLVHEETDLEASNSIKRVKVTSAD